MIFYSVSMNRDRVDRMPVKLMVFDLDGTLVDSLPLVLSAIAHALEPFGTRPTMEIFAKLGGPPERFIPDLVGDPAHAPEALRRLGRFFVENEHLISPFSGARDLLVELTDAGVACAVWTGRDRFSTERLLARHALEPLLPHVICGDDLPSHKPDPAGLRELLRRLGAAPDAALMIGDADVDVLGGAECGAETCLIRHARSIDAAVLARARHVVETPAQAYRLVRDRVRLG